MTYYLGHIAIENTTQEEIPISSRIVPRDILVKEAP